MKTIQKAFSFLFFLFIINFVSGQNTVVELKNHPRLDTFDLSKYVLPDLKYKGMDLNFDFNGNNSFIDINDLIFQRYDNNGFFENLNHVDGNISLSGFLYKNNRKNIKTISNNLNLGGLYSSFKYHDIASFKTQEGKKRNFSLYFRTNRDYKFYGNNKKFWGINAIASARYDYNKMTGEYLPGKNHEFSTMIIPGIFIGKGRIEDITDSWHTIRILKDFSRLNLLDKNPTDSDIIALSESISRIKNTRIFDNRIAFKEKLKELDNRINELGLVSDRGFDYFTSLNDMWLYGVDNRRLSGKLISLGIQPFYVLNKNSNSEFGIYGANLASKYEYHKPVNMFYQFDLKSSINLYYAKSYSFILDDKFYHDQLGLVPGFVASVSYFPTSRTSLKSSFYGNMSIPLENDSDDKGIHYEIGLFNEIHYYLSPKARISGYIDIFYRNDNFNRFSGLNSHFTNNVIHYNIVSRSGFNYSTGIKFNYSLY